MIILADTSVWIDHWRRGNPRFRRLLEADQIVVHPFVLGEIALGAITPRADVLTHLRALRAPRVAQHTEVMALIDHSRLWSRGIGWVDVHLLASALLDQIRLWTLDQALARAAHALGVAAGS
ncbi:MAG TPA: PIN domain-containing protein [Gemmatimonadales bacterium]|nr:PIN domain-containing protein [Gemmatimonadales bacterium]